MFKLFSHSANVKTVAITPSILPWRKLSSCAYTSAVVETTQAKRSPCIPTAFHWNPALVVSPHWPKKLLSSRAWTEAEKKLPASTSQGYDIAKTILEVLEQTGYARRKSQVYLQCFDDKALRYLRNTLKTELPLIQLIAENNWGEDSEVDYDYLQTALGLKDIASYADGIGPWIMQIYRGKSDDGEAITSSLVDDALGNGLEIHPYTFRRDELPAGISDFNELLDIFINQAKITGLFTDFPDLVRSFLRQ